MGRVAHQKSAKQSGPLNGVRGSKVAKQRKNHKVVIESESQDKEKSRAVLSFRADPPPGYTFIPAGNPQLTSALKEFAKKGNHQIFAVTTTPHAARHELSREVHRIGFHFPTEVVAQVCNHYGIRLTSGGKLVEEKDDDKLFMRLYQKGQLVLDEKVRDQVTINTEAKQIIQDLFPHIPDNDLFQIIKTAFQLGDGKVGTADEIPLVRRAQLSVVAHIRHTYTNYDKLLRSVPYSEARHRVESITLQKLIDWRGDGQDDNHAMDDTLREVVVISDEEESDEIEEGQLLENDDLRVQPVNGSIRHRDVTDGRPRSPIEIHSDDEAPRGYRYLAPAVRRVPIQDLQAVSVARQQSRYAVWDRVRQEYRNGTVQQPTRVIERIPIDEPPMNMSQESYVTREPLYVTEPLPRRVPEPTARTISQPSPPQFIRGADGKLYERINTHSEQVAAPSPLRKLYTPPPTNHGHRYIDSRPASPRPQPSYLHRRTESYDNNDGTVLPSIEGPGANYQSPTSRRNPFGDSRPPITQRNQAFYETNQHQSQIIDLTSSAEQASKRRRMEDTPPSPYVIRNPERVDYERNEARGNTRHQYVEHAYAVQQQPPPSYQAENSRHEFQSPRLYARSEVRPQPTVIYREDIPNREVPSPRFVGMRPPHPLSNHDPYHVQSVRRVEYASEYERDGTRSLGEPPRQYPQGIAMQLNGDRNTNVVLEDLTIHGQSPGYRMEPTTRYLHSENRNPFETIVQRQHYIQDLPPEAPQREHISSTIHEYPSSRDVPMLQLQDSRGMYQQPRMAPPPPPSNIYRDGRNLRTTYVQN